MTMSAGGDRTLRRIASSGKLSVLAMTMAFTCLPAVAQEQAGTGASTPDTPSTTIVTTAEAPPKTARPLAEGELPSTVMVPPPPGDLSGIDPLDLAYGAFQRGWFMTTAVRAKPLADGGIPQAQTLMGVLYQAGLGLKKDMAKAAAWYAKAAEAEDITATEQLAQLYLLGEGVPADKSKAADLFEKVAATGNPAAMYNLALIYQEGVGRPQDVTKALTLLRQAAEGNHPDAQYNLGLSYLQAAEEDKSDADAETLRQGAFWLGRAARRGHVEAQVYYGILRFQGRGVEPDEREAADWFERAAQSGNAVAMNRLARCFAAGRGRDPDPVEAVRWHFLARTLGVNDEALDKLAASLDEDTRKEAERMALQFSAPGQKLPETASR